MEENTTLLTRFVSFISGEVSADTLEAYRRASLAVLELLDQAELERLKASAEGQNPWTMPKAKQAELACIWNSFVLQTLGNAFLDADYRDNPATKGFVPPITADQILRFYAPVEGWLTRAQSAHANPHYVLDVSVPSALPAWSEVEPCPNSHLHGMLEAMIAIRNHAQAAMNVLDSAKDLSEVQEKQRGKVHELYAAATTKARYAEEMHRKDPTRDVHERIEEHLKVVIEQFYLLGQWVAMPQNIVTDIKPAPLLASVPPKVVTTAPKTPPRPTMLLPGEKDFDIWCLTSSAARKNYAYDRQAKTALETLWKIDPNPAATMMLKAEVDAAYTRGDITYATDRNGKPVGFFFCCPWGTIYSVVRSVKIGGVSLVPLQQFVLDVTAEGFNLGVPFRRQIKVGAFKPTDEFEYGDPDEEPDH
jgi:hypothetical protein